MSEVETIEWRMNKQNHNIITKAKTWDSINPWPSNPLLKNSLEEQYVQWF